MTGSNEPPKEPADEASADELARENAKLRAELEAAEAKTSAVRRTRMRRTRRVVAAILVVLTSLSVLASTVGVWANRTLWNTDAYLRLVAPLAQDRAVTDQLALKLTDEVFVALDLDQRVSALIEAIPHVPAQAALIAGPLTSSLHNVVLGQVKGFLASPAFQNLWVEINRQVHPKVVALLQGDYSQLPNVSISGGDVQLNLIPVLEQVLQRVIGAFGLNVTLPQLPADIQVPAAIASLGSTLGVSLPPDFGQVTIMSADQLSSIQQAARDVRRLAWGLVILTVVLGALAVAVSTDRRRTLVWLGLGAVAALLIGGPTIRAIERSVTNAIATPGGRSVATEVFAQVTNGLRRIGWVIIAVALLLAIVAHLAGRPRWLRAAREKVGGLAAGRPDASRVGAFAAHNADGVRVVAIGVAVLLLVLVGIGWISVILIGGLLALVLWWVAVTAHRAGGSGGEPAPETGDPG